MDAGVSLLDPLFTTEAMRSVFSDRVRVQRMLDFEAALARAEARVGVIPVSAVAVIEAQCHTHLFEVKSLARATALAGNPAIPLVKQLTARVGADDPEAAKFVHWGATSQDVIDTGLMLQLREAMDIFEADLAHLAETLAGLAQKYRLTPMVGRTLLQQALPTTFGLKVAGWLDAVGRHRERLQETRQRVLVLQFGGAAGTLAALGTQGLDVAAALADELGLALPDLPWHSQRDRVAEAATTLALLVGTLGKMARDVALLMQTEVGEAFEPAAEGKGGSSTLPHKRNPVNILAALAAAIKVPSLTSTMLAAMVQEHERAVGGWHAEWDTLPEIALFAAGALHQVAQTMAGLEVNAAGMRKNLDTTRGLILAEAVTMALGSHIGRLAAHKQVERAARTAVEENRYLQEVLAQDPEVTVHLTPHDLDRLFDPANYVGVAGALVDRAVSTSQREVSSAAHAKD
jgi:3-carboxy-cis,cis-muconate cycloisomerase